MYYFTQGENDSKKVKYSPPRTKSSILTDYMMIEEKIQDAKHIIPKKVALNKKVENTDNCFKSFPKSMNIVIYIK